MTGSPQEATQPPATQCTNSQARFLLNSCPPECHMSLGREIPSWFPSLGSMSEGLAQFSPSWKASPTAQVLCRGARGWRWWERWPCNPAAPGQVPSAHLLESPSQLCLCQCRSIQGHSGDRQHKPDLSCQHTERHSTCAHTAMPSDHPGKLNRESPISWGTLTTQLIQLDAEVSYLLPKAMAAFIFLCQYRPERIKELNRLVEAKGQFEHDNNQKKHWRGRERYNSPTSISPSCFVEWHLSETARWVWLST